MGLLYVFPVSVEEKDFVDVKDQGLTLKTYGLPYIFWGYAFAVLAVIFFMFLAIKAPVLKLVQLGDETDALLGYSLLSFIGCMPIFILAFFFYEKRLIKKPGNISIQHRVFGLPFFTETHEPAEKEPYVIQPYLSSPNMARLQASEENKGFQNKGYFVLWLNTKKGLRVQLDRHSRKADLQKLEELIRMIP